MDARDYPLFAISTAPNLVNVGYNGRLEHVGWERRMGKTDGNMDKSEPAAGKEPSRLTNIEPILAVRDVTATTAYYRDVLDFSDVWLWGEPPNHGGANRDGIQVQFSQDPALSVSAEGRAIWIRVQNVAKMFTTHRERGAEITSALEPKPWGVSEYTVRDLNGYRLRFAGTHVRSAPSRELPAGVQLESRMPTWPEMRVLVHAVGWDRNENGDSAPRVLEAALFGTLAVVQGQVVGCAFVTGDNAGFYYIRDVIVHPAWQGQHIGTALMEEVMIYLREHAAAGSLVGLFTGEGLHDFYAKFGFHGARSGGLYGMTLAMR